MPPIDDLEGSLEKAVLADWRKTGKAAGKIRWSDGEDYYFRIESAVLNPTFTANLLLIANGNEFAADIRNLNERSEDVGLITCLLFIPAAWVVGSRMSTTLKTITSQAEQLQAMARRQSR